jgi:arylsulfatase A-like enzyme
LKKINGQINPFFVTGPGIKPSEKNQLVLNIDILPTILELAGIEINPNIHGQSLVPLLKGNTAEWREAFIYEGLGTYGGAKPNLTVYDQNFRYIVTYENKSLDNVIFRELYDQSEDALEMENLAESPGHQPVIEKFDALILKHVDEIIQKKEGEKPGLTTTNITYN